MKDEDKKKHEPVKSQPGKSTQPHTPGFVGRADPSNEHKEENGDINKELSEEDRLAKTPTTPFKSKFGSKNPKVGSHRVVIKAISGKKMTVVGGEFGDDEEGTDILISKRAKVVLNGKDATLAALDNGDTVVLGMGKMNERTHAFEYGSIVATRKEV